MCIADRAFALHRAIDGSETSDKFLIDMARHGHVPEAVQYVTGWSEQKFPYHAARHILHQAKDDDAGRGILRSALLASGRRVDVDWHELRLLFSLLQFQSHLLPHDEARDELRRLVGYIRMSADDLQGSFRVGGPHGPVTFTTQAPSLLFELLGPLRLFDPELAEIAIREHPQLARASEVYPNGHDSFVHRPTERLSDEALARWKRDWTGFTRRNSLEAWLATGASR
jgi:hypothetical protein